MLHRDRALLVVVDVQSRLLPTIHEAEETVRQIVRAIRGFQIAGAPVVATEQYRRGLGATHPAVQEAMRTAPAPDGSLPETGIQVADAFAALPGFQAIEKTTFSCAADPGFLAEIESIGRRQVVLAGIEAHVCVLQTALQLVERDLETYVLADAVSSRKPRSVEIALQRMTQEGVRLASVEMAVFEMLHLSGTPEFKAWLQVIR